MELCPGLARLAEENDTGTTLTESLGGDLGASMISTAIEQVKQASADDATMHRWQQNRKSTVAASSLKSGPLPASNATTAPKFLKPRPQPPAKDQSAGVSANLTRAPSGLFARRSPSVASPQAPTQELNAGDSKPSAEHDATVSRWFKRKPL